MAIELSRRVVLLSSGAFGAGLVLGLSACEPGRDTRAGALGDWLRIAPDGTTTILVNATDIGQGAQTGLAQIVADELDADWSKVRVELAPVAQKYLVKDGGYYTGGSSSIRPQFDAFRRIGATARVMLIAAAAKEWSVEPATCTTRHGVVRDAASGREIDYGTLAASAAQLSVPVYVALKSSAQRRLIGRSIPRLDIPEKVDGRAIYGIDVKLPELRTATLAQCPFKGGRLKSLNEAAARAVKGVEDVVKLDENTVIVVARGFYAAKKGLQALSLQWTRPTGTVESDASMMARLRGNIGAPDSIVVTLDKNAKRGVEKAIAAFASAAHIVEREYRVPLLAHATLEPQNATARVTSTGCELWAPMQDQKQMRDDLAKALDLPPDAILLHTTKAGGGFGRRLETDYGALAARTSRATGKPIKLIWTREEDFGHDFFRPASIGRVKAALDSSWRILAIDYTGATSNDTATGGLAHNYQVPDVVIRQKRTALPFRIGAWRSVDPSITVFFIESLVDEIAHAAGSDAIAYRRKLLENNPRGLRVLDAVAEMSNWGRSTSGHALGMAFMSQAYWGTALAEVIELSVASGKIALHKVYCAIDPGTAVNPGAIEAQVQGGIGMGLSAALGEAITFRDGLVEQTNFDRYRILKLAAAPEIEVRILETPGATIGGIGEPPVPPAAPALANAIFAATGQRIRSLPILANGFSA